MSPQGPRRRRRRRWTKPALLLLGVLILGFSWPVARAGTALVISHSLQSPDAIVMLASHEWERLPAAAALARAYPDAVVILTVPTIITPHNCHLCTKRVAWLGVEGIPSSRVRLLPRTSMNTYEEAAATRAYAESQNLLRLLVVTSPYHTRRAWHTFKAVFRGTHVSLGIVPAAGAQGQPGRWWTSPYDRYYVGYEWAATVKYRLAYGIEI
jgi:uncharacterized SAM-binding protein YcdF (DUF218 family)